VGCVDWSVARSLAAQRTFELDGARICFDLGVRRIGRRAFDGSGG
jgi:hypothetical protein